MSGENFAYRVDRDANVKIRTRECALRDRGGGDDAELKLLRVLWMVAVMMLIAAGQGIAEDEMQPKLAFVRICSRRYARTIEDGLPTTCIIQCAITGV